VDSSAFGPTGPWANRLGYGPLVRAAAGFTAQWAYPGERDAFCDAVTVYPDHVAARIGALAALALLLRRERTGTGGAASVAQSEVMISHLAAEIAGKVAGLPEQQPEHPWGLFPARGDDAWVAVTVRDDADHRALRTVIGEQCLESQPNVLVIRFSEDAARDPRLIGDDDHRDLRIVQSPDGLRRTIEENDLLGTSNVLRVVNDGAIPIEKGGAGLTVTKSAAWLIVLQIGAFLGYISFGWIADRIGRRPAFTFFMIAATAVVPIFAFHARSPMTNVQKIFSARRAPNQTSAIFCEPIMFGSTRSSACVLGSKPVHWSTT
jgi:hypothetical protein